MQIWQVWPFNHRRPPEEKKRKMTASEIDVAIEAEQERAQELVTELNETITQQRVLWLQRRGQGGG